MHWLHIARIPGTDGSGSWLVVPGIHDPLFVWAMGQIHPGYQVKSLSTFGGWLVPQASENLLWGAIAQTHGTAIICPQCFHEELPCEAWINIVTKRFEAAHAVQQEQAKWQLGGGQAGSGQLGSGQTYGSIYGDTGNTYPRVPGYRDQSSQYWQPGPTVDQSASDLRNERLRQEHIRLEQARKEQGRREQAQREQAQREQTRNRSRRQANDYSGYQQPPPRPAPKKPEPTKEERMNAAAKTLGITWPATKADVKRAFAKAVLKAHPDMGGSSAAFIVVKQARDTLTANV